MHIVALFTSPAALVGVKTAFITCELWGNWGAKLLHGLLWKKKLLSRESAVEAARAQRRLNCESEKIKCVTMYNVPMRKAERLIQQLKNLSLLLIRALRPCC